MVTDPDIIDAIRSRFPVAGTRQLADEFGMTRQGMINRLRKVDGIESVDVGQSKGWLLSEWRQLDPQTDTAVNHP